MYVFRENQENTMLTNTLLNTILRFQKMLKITLHFDNFSKKKEVEKGTEICT